VEASRVSIIYIEHDADAIAPLIIRNLRLDIGAGEPQALQDEITLAPGQSALIPLYCGGTIILQPQEKEHP
jgi:hypothetical protein